MRGADNTLRRSAEPPIFSFPIAYLAAKFDILSVYRMRCNQCPIVLLGNRPRESAGMAVHNLIAKL